MSIKTASLQAAALYPGADKFLTVIGSPSAGPPAGYGEVKSFSLPYLGLGGQYSTTYFSLPQGVPAGNAFAPDVQVANRSTDYFARHDPVMAAMIARSGAPPPPPAGSAVVVSAASFRTDQAIAAGSYAAAFGSFPANVDSVFVDGQKAQIIISTSGQINLIVPADTAAGIATISVRAGTAEAATGQFTVAPQSLSFFPYPPMHRSRARF